MAKKSKKYPGVYSVKGKKGVSYGIDFVHPLTGERIRGIRKGATSEAKAFELRSIEIADARRGATNKAYGLKARIKPVPFAQMVRIYLEWVKENRKDWKGKEYIAKPHLLPAFKGKLLTDINPFMIEKYRMAKVKVLAKRTVNKHLSFISQVFEKAIEWGKFDGSNPMDSVKLFKVKKGKKPGALTPEEVAAWLKEITHSVRRDMVEFNYNTGWRISEIRTLKRSDVDLEGGVAWIVDPKNGDTVEIELSDKALQIIARQPELSEFVFTKKNGTPYTTNCADGLYGAAKRAGVQLPKGKAWHSLRRTWASMMLQNGCDVETLRQLGNWKDHQMPMWYAEPAGRERKRTLLNNIPSLDKVESNGRKTAEIEKVVNLTP